MTAERAVRADGYPPVPLDRELEPHVLACAARRTPITPQSLAARQARRSDRSGGWINAPDGIGRKDIKIPGPPGAPALPATILRPPGRAPGPVALYFHGGGLVSGHRAKDAARAAQVAQEVTVVTVDYRLAPEHPYPAAIEDAYAALAWTARAGRELGHDGRIVVAGFSAGGCLAAGATLMARDRGGPPVEGVMLLAPMLDDRMETVSCRQVTPATWTAHDNKVAWGAVLGAAAGGPHVSPYAAPARAASLAGFPPTYLEVGTADIFRDEAVLWALRAWGDGVALHLVVAAGAPHGYDTLAPGSRLARAARQDRARWLRGLLAGPACQRQQHAPYGWRRWPSPRIRRFRPG